MVQLMAIAFFIIWIAVGIYAVRTAPGYRTHDLEAKTGLFVGTFFVSCFFTTLAGIVICIAAVALGIEVSL